MVEAGLVIVQHQAKGAHSDAKKGVQLGGKVSKIGRVAVADRSARAERIAEPHARLPGDAHRFGELGHDLTGIRLPPARAVLAVVLRSVHIKIVSMLADETDQVVPLWK